jgi:predicted CopG family antitoxin
MAVKTITIDSEAYNRLKRLKREHESFSQTIKRLAPKPFDFDAFLKRLEAIGPDEEYAHIMDDVVANRGRHSRKG